VQRGPEAVAATREVSVDGSGPQPRVDADEQDSDAAVDEVVDRRALPRGKLRGGEPDSWPRFARVALRAWQVGVLHSRRSY